jgi:hypothetical protein
VRHFSDVVLEDHLQLPRREYYLTEIMRIHQLEVIFPTLMTHFLTHLLFYHQASILQNDVSPDEREGEDKYLQEK